jgi:hypothetical protein
MTAGAVKTWDFPIDILMIFCILPTDTQTMQKRLWDVFVALQQNIRQG